MGMTIDKAIKMLEEIIDEGWLISDLEKCPAIDACELAINIMRKYQRVQEIIKSEMSYDSSNMNPNNLSGLARALEIFGEVEDGECK